MKIFVSIASYQDPILKYTIKSITENAKYKNDLVVGVFDQAEETLTDLPSNVRYKTCHPKEAKGCCWARSTIQKELFEGEDIFMQIDSHTLFAEDWDKNLLQKYEDCKNWFEKPLITGYPRGFDVIVKGPGFFNSDEEYIFKKADRNTNTHIMTIHLPFDNGYHSGQIAKAMNDNKYYRGFGLSAGLIFTEGNFVKEVPYDPRIYFGGEETPLAVRAYTHGYELVHVPDTPLWHWYNSDNQELKRELHWTMHEQDENLKKAKDDYIASAKIVVDNVLQGKDTLYGLGDKRTLKDFAGLSGLDYTNKSVQMDKCLFKEYEEAGFTLDDDFE